MGTIMMTLVNGASYTLRDYIFFLLNLAIIAGYMTIVVTVLFPHRIIPVMSFFLSRRSRAATAGFFFVAALTRATLAWSTVDQSRLAACPNTIVDEKRIICLADITNTTLVFHSLQAILIWVMVVFLSIDLIKKVVVNEDEE